MANTIKPRCLCIRLRRLPIFILIRHSLRRGWHVHNPERFGIETQGLLCCYLSTTVSAWTGLQTGGKRKRANSVTEHLAPLTEQPSTHAKRDHSPNTLGDDEYRHMGGLDSRKGITEAARDRYGRVGK